MKLPDVGNRPSSPDHGELALVPVMEGSAWLSGEIPLNDSGDVLAHLNRHRRNSGQRAGVVMIEEGGIAQDEYLGVPRYTAVRLNDGPPGVIQRSIERLQYRARDVAGCPDHRLRRN